MNQSSDPPTSSPISDPHVEQQVATILANQQHAQAAHTRLFNRYNTLLAALLSTGYSAYSWYLQGTSFTIFMIISLVPGVVLIAIGNPFIWLKGRLRDTSTFPTVHAQGLGWIYIITTILTGLILGSQMSNLTSILTGSDITDPTTAANAVDLLNN